MKKIISILCLILLATALVLGGSSYSKNMVKITRVQRQQISSISRELRQETDRNMGRVVLIFLLYGVIHSLGPGHGKSIVSGIFLSEDKKIVQIGIFSGIICYSQGLMAYLMVKAFSIIGETLLPQSAFRAEEDLRLISASMILFIGSLILYRKVAGSHEHKHTSSRNTLAAVILLGLTPCFGTVNMLLFLGAMGLSNFQLMGTLAISTGMFITVSTIGVLTTTFKSIGKGAGRNVIKTIEFIGPVIMIVYSLSVLKNGVF